MKRTSKRQKCGAGYTMDFHRNLAFGYTYRTCDRCGRQFAGTVAPLHYVALEK